MLSTKGLIGLKRLLFHLNCYIFRNFQLFFAQRMLHDDSPTKRKAASALAETRMALTSLKSFKRRNIANVPVERVGDSLRSTVPGVVRQQAGNFDNRLPNSNVMVNVYEVSYKNVLMKNFCTVRNHIVTYNL